MKAGAMEEVSRHDAEKEEPERLWKGGAKGDEGIGDEERKRRRRKQSVYIAHRSPVPSLVQSKYADYVIGRQASLRNLQKRQVRRTLHDGNRLGQVFIDGFSIP